jgi:hypothetical protein
MVVRLILWLNDAVGTERAVLFWVILSVLCFPGLPVPGWVSDDANWLAQVTFPLVLFSVVIFAQNYHSARLDDLHDKHDALAETLKPTGDTLD